MYLVNYSLAENLLIQNYLLKEQTIAKAGSLSIEDLLTTVQNELNSFVFSFTQVNDYAPIDIEATRQGFKDYISKAQLPINGIAYYDQTGKLVVIEDKQHLHIGEGQDFSNTSYIQWAENPANKNTLYISTPYISVVGGSVGKTIIIVLKPIYFGNIYKGALGVRILLGDLEKAFVAPLISSAEENSFIIDSNGVVIASQANLLNKNLFTYAKKQRWERYTDFTTLLTTALRKNDTKTLWFFQNPSDTSKEYLAGISRIDIPNTDKDLFLVVSSPKENITSLLRWFRDYGYIWLGFSVIVTIIESSIIIFLQKKILS